MTEERSLVDYDFPDLGIAHDGLVADGEIVGVLADGRVAFWGDPDGSAYVTGAIVQEVVQRQLGVMERERLERDCWSLGLQGELVRDVAPAPFR